MEFGVASRLGALMNNVAMNILHRPLGEKPFLADMCLGIQLLLRRVCLLSASVDKARPSPE